MFESGASYREISETVGTPISTCRVWAKRDAWSRAKSESNEIVIGDDPEIAIHDMDLPEQAETYEADMRIAALKFSHHVKNLPPDQIAARADKIKSLDGVNRRALKIETERPPVAIQIGVLMSSPAKLDQKRLHSLVRPAKQLPAAESD